MRPRLVRSAAAIASATALLLLASCQGGDEKEASDVDAQSTAAAAARSRLTASKPVLDELTVTTCATGRGDVEATGVIRNGTRATQDYVVSVTWLDAKSTIVRASTSTVKNVAKGDSTPWTISTKLSRPAASCTSRLDRGQLR